MSVFNFLVRLVSQQTFVFTGAVAGTSILPWIWRKRHVLPSLVGFHYILCYQLRNIVESRLQIQTYALVPERTVSKDAWCTKSQTKTIALYQRQEKSIGPELHWVPLTTSYNKQILYSKMNFLLASMFKKFRYNKYQL